MNTTVPPTTKVRRSRAHNIDTDRLMARREHLIDLIDNRSHTLPTRMRFAERAAELTAIESALVARGDLSATDRRTIVSA